LEASKNNASCIAYQRNLHSPQRKKTTSCLAGIEDPPLFVSAVADADVAAIRRLGVPS